MKRRKGFTLLELSIVLAVIAIFTGGIFVVFRQSPRSALENASLQLRADMRYAQRRAIIDGQRIDIMLEPAHNRYRVRVVGGSWEEIRVVYFQDGVRLRGTNISGNNVEFLPRGTINGAGRIYLDNGRYSLYLTTLVSSGRVRISDTTVN